MLRRRSQNKLKHFGSSLGVTNGLIVATSDGMQANIGVLETIQMVVPLKESCVRNAENQFSQKKGKENRMIEVRQSNLLFTPECLRWHREEVHAYDAKEHPRGFAPSQSELPTQLQPPYRVD